MIKVIIITHGQLGSEMLRTAESIVGRQEDSIILTLEANESLASMCQRTGEVLKDIDDSEGALILTDMLGGTPCNACLPFCSSYNLEIVSGLNLYMLLSSFIHRPNLNLKELANKVINDGQKSITNAKEMFLKKLQ